MNITYNNYFSCFGSGSTFTVKRNKITRPPNTFLEEACIAAEEIYKNRNEILYLMYSGGIDSEFMLSVFLSLNIPFVPVIIDLQPNYNLHDTKYAFSFCKQNSLTPLIISIDFDEFVMTGKINEIAETAECAWYQLPTTLFAEQQLKGSVITASGEPDFVKKDNKWFYYELEEIKARINWREKNNIDGTPFFMSYTPEMCYSFIEDDIFASLLNNHRPGYQHSFNYKKNLYRKFFPLKNRPKYTGFEIIEKSEIFQHPNLKKFNVYQQKWGGIYETTYEEFKQQLSF
jgi:hypothetical protein